MIDTPIRPLHSFLQLLPEIATLLGFTLTMAVTQRVGAAVGVALVLGVAAVGLRLRRRRSPWQAVAALGIVAIGAVLVLVSGQAQNFFLPSLVMHVVVATTVIVLVGVGRPPLGLLFGSPGGHVTDWRGCRTRRRAYGTASLVMAIPPLVMLSVGVPLYLAGETVALGMVEVANPILFALAGFVAWRVYHYQTKRHDCGTTGCEPNSD